MPAPQASMMQQFARLKFTSFALKVPTNFTEPSGDPDGQQYRDAFKPEELTTAPGSPPLFLPASMNKYHTDTQKMHIAKVGKFIDDTCTAICSAWSTWQSSAAMAGIVVVGPLANAGQLVGPPWTPLILAQAPMTSPMEAKYSAAIANVLGTSWLTYTATIKFAATPVWPQFAAFALPVVPPQPGVPVPFKSLVQVPISISPMLMKQQMVGMLGDPMAPFHAELFEAICDGFDKCFQIWSAATLVNNVLGFGGVPTWTPVSPAGPVVGTATMAPGGLT